MADMNLSSEDLRALIEAVNANTRAVLKMTTTSEKIAKDEKRAATKSNTTNTRQAGPAPTGDAAIIRRLIADQNKLSGVTQVVSKKLGSVVDATENATKNFKRLSAASGGASKALSDIVPMMGRIFGAAGVVKLMAETLDDTTKTYRELTQVGQTFNGSMLSMQIAAAEAALPLQEFAEVVKKNSTVIAAIGTSSFMSMSKALRMSLKDVGQLGLTTSQLNANLGQYLDTQRMYGNLSNQSTEKTTANVRALGIETLKAAHMTGMHTEKINESAAAALRDESLRAKMMQLSANSIDTYGLALNKAVIYMSALPGEAGKTLSNMLAQTVGRGTALLTDASQTFIDAGLFGVTDMMDNMAKKVANNTWTDQDAAEFNRKFVAEGMKNMASLQMQAATGNNQAAKQAIVMISEMKEIAKKTPEELKAQKGVTNFLLNLSTIIDQVSGLIRERFYKGLEALMTRFEGFTDSPAWTAFSAKIGDMAERFGLFLSETITPERLIAFGGGIASALEATVKFATVVATIVEKVASVFGWLHDKLGLFGAALTAFVAWQTAKAAGGAAMGGIGRVRELLSERFNIGGGDRTETLTQGGVQSAFEQALNRFSAGNALRITEGGGPLDNNRRGRNGRGTQGRRGGRANIRNPGSPQLPNLPNGPRPGPSRMDRLDSIADRLTEFRRNSAENVRRTIRNPGTTGRNVVRRVAPSIRRAGRMARAGAGRVARSGMASNLMRGGAAVARGLGPMALGTIGIQALSAVTPEFTGKETLSSMAQGAMIGSVLGPVGAAVGAGVGAIYANWDELSNTVSDAFTSVANFDYMGTIQSAAKYLAPLGGALGMGAMALYHNWDSAKNTVSEGFKAIANFDYAGTFAQVASFLSPISDGVKWYVDTLWGAWKKVGSTMMNGFDTVKNYLFGGDNETNKAEKQAQSMNAHQQTITQKWSNLTNPFGMSVLNGSMSPEMNMPMSLSSNTGLDMVNNQKLGLSIVAPKNPNTPSAPKLNTDNVNAQSNAWKEQSLQLQRENLETRRQMAQMLDTVANGTNQTVGGLRDLIGEQQKGNRNLDVISSSVI